MVIETPSSAKHDMTNQGGRVLCEAFSRLPQPPPVAPPKTRVAALTALVLCSLGKDVGFLSGFEPHLAAVPDLVIFRARRHRTTKTLLFKKGISI